ncbi:MAG: hypothetical protein ACLS4Z_03090 [Christensenellaceae bacterium]
MKNIWTIMKKEFSRFFKDKRLVLALVLPGILIYVIYSFLGQGVFDKSERRTKITSIRSTPSICPIPLRRPSPKTKKSISSQLRRRDGGRQGADCRQKADLLAVFPEISRRRTTP